MTENKAASAREPAITRFLHVVEWLGNALPHPVTLFALFSVGVVLLSVVFEPAEPTSGWWTQGP